MKIRKIAIDLRPLQIGHQNRGIGAYLLNILEYLPTDGVEYMFLRYKTSDPIADYGIGENRIYREKVFTRYKFSKRPLGLLKFTFGLFMPKFLPLFLYRPDVFFQTDYLIGIPNRLICSKTVLTCYDMIPMRLKEMYLPDWRKQFSFRQFSLKARLRMAIRSIYYRELYRNGVRSIRKATKIISISKTTTKDLIEIAAVKKNKIRTIPIAPSYRKIVKTTPSITTKNPYLFFIGGTDKRRQVQHLIGAFNKLNARGIKTDLVLAGAEFSGHSKEIRFDIKNRIDSSSYRDQIYMVGNISESEKHFYMSNALAFVYPSLYEGFGMPVLEAMAVRTPVIAYNNSSIPEIAGNTIFYSEESSDGIFDNVIKIIDPKFRDILNKKLGSALEKSSEYSWKECAQKTLSEILS